MTSFLERWEKAETLLAQTPHVGRFELAKQLDCTENQARTILEKFRRGERASHYAGRGNSGNGGHSHHNGASSGGVKFRHAQSVEAFRRQFDVPLKITEALKELGENVILDNDFRTELSVPAQSWAIARNRDEFAKNQIKIHGKIYWAQEKYVKTIRDTIDIL